MSTWRESLVQRVGPGCLAGVTPQTWCEMLWENSLAVTPANWIRAGYLTVSSGVTLGFTALDKLLYDRRIAQTQVASPVFVLGAWRSGTTHLHNLMCVDARYGAPNLFQTMYPHSFLSGEPVFRPFFDLFMPRQRFMDNMKIGMQEPAEDEMALGIACGLSNMLGWVFPRRRDHYDRFLSFRTATPAESEKWKRCLDWYLRKLTIKLGKPLILKSPNHTARIKLLLELFPDAKFVHIRRNPFDVFRSTCHMASKVMPMWTLQTVPTDKIPDIVLGMYRELYDSFFEQSPLIPPGNFHEIAYEDLAQRPVEVLEQTYEKLGLPSFSEVREPLTTYVKSVADYRPNRHEELDPALRERIVTEWRRSFEAWGYAT